MEELGDVSNIFRTKSIFFVVIVKVFCDHHEFVSREDGDTVLLLCLLLLFLAQTIFEQTITLRDFLAHNRVTVGLAVSRITILHFTSDLVNELSQTLHHCLKKKKERGRREENVIEQVCSSSF